MNMTFSHFIQKIEGNEIHISLKGKWILSQAVDIKKDLDKLSQKKIQKVLLDAKDILELDSAGATLILELIHFFKEQKVELVFLNISQQFEPLFKRIQKMSSPKIPKEKKTSIFVESIVEIGKQTNLLIQDAILLISFFGEILVIGARTLLKPIRFRWTSLFNHVRVMGFDALPIIGLLTFLVGIVLAYQGATQLQRFGADIYTVNLVGIATLRELGILLTAVIVAGRTGSAIAAQIGTMSVNEEIDALKTMGIHPIEILVLPRILALVIALPLLTFYGNILALIGGGVGCWMLLDISPQQYIIQLKQAVTLTALWVGLSKAPVFAFIIGMVGSFEGLKVKGSAESVGIHTTASVVKSLFIIIVFDALFSVFFTYLDI